MDDDKFLESRNEGDSTSSEDEEETRMENRTVTLEQSLENNAYQYEVHVELVELYTKLADLNSMRAAYERFSNLFPLTPKIWLDWITVEKKLAAPNVVKDLFIRAVEDYLSADLWLEYAFYSMSHPSLEDPSNVFNFGLNAVGYHFSEADKLWGAFLEYEKVKLTQFDEFSNEWNKQLNVIVDLYKRRLNVPLRDLQQTRTELDEILENLPDKNQFDSKTIEWSYQSSLRLAEICKPYEEKLREAQTENDFLKTFREYIDVIKEPTIKLCLYERAVSQISLCVDIWKDYCYFALTLGDVAESVTKKAVRNCPWCEDLWILRIRILERQRQDEETIRKCFEEGMQAIIPSPGLNLWFSYIENVRRTQESTNYLHKLMTQAAEQLGSLGDPMYSIQRFQAKIYAKEKNMKSARNIWTQILTDFNYKRSATAWLEYAALEKQYGDPTSLRKLYNQALNLCKESNSYIIEDWISFERENGSLQDVLDCMVKCRKFSESLQPHPTDQSKNDNSSSKKRAHDFEDVHSKSKKFRKVEKQNEANFSNSFPKKKFFRDSNNSNNTVNVEEIESESINPKKKIMASEIDTDKSVFVSNMRDSVDEEILQAFFPTAIKICIPERKNNSNRFGYVQFQTELEVAEALARDRELLEERPLFISKCIQDRTQRKPVFKYSKSLEENKLFVRGLPLSFSDADVENIFKPYGSISIRLATRRDGHSKGFAYVEFENKTAAKNALKATNETEVGGRTITVAISAPPAKETSAPTKLEEPIRHARSRLQVPLVPRIVQVKFTESDASVAGPSKSNSDFRKMLLGDKAN